MAVNGVEITAGSVWRRGDGQCVRVVGHNPGSEYGWFVRWSSPNPENLGRMYWVNDDGKVENHLFAGAMYNLVELCKPTPKPEESPHADQKQTNPKDLVGVRKAPMSTVSAAVLAEVGVGMLEGACKYGRHNYREVGVRSSVYYDGTMRHLMSWWEGEDIDPDSQMSHITKAITSLVVLRDAMIQGKLTDDRAPRSVEFYKALNERAAAIIDQYADRNPVHYTIENCVVTK